MLLPLVLMLVFGIIACTRQSQQKSNEDKVVVRDVVVQQVEDVDPVPPPPVKMEKLGSRSETLQQWLSYLCVKEKPAKKISIFSFVFYHSPNEYLLTFVGINGEQNKNVSYRRIDFQPNEKWFSFSQKEYKNLTNEQIRQNLASQLKAFTQTDEFKKSFFENADSIDLDGAVIWRKI